MSMKKIVGFLFVIFCFSASSSAQSMTEIVKSVSNIKGKILFLGEGMNVIVPDDNPNMRYFGSNLPDAFKIDGLAVIFSGDVYKIPPNVRAIGQPIKFKSISISVADKKKYHLKKSKYCFK